MNIFKDNKTFDEISIPFLQEREIELAKRTVVGYSTKVKVFSRWLTEKGYSNLIKIYYLCMDWIVRSSYLMTRVNRTPFQSLFCSVNLNVRNNENN